MEIENVICQEEMIFVMAMEKFRIFVWKNWKHILKWM